MHYSNTRARTPSGDRCHTPLTRMPVMSGEGCRHLGTAHVVDIRQYWAVKVATLNTTRPKSSPITGLRYSRRDVSRMTHLISVLTPQLCQPWTTATIPVLSVKGNFWMTVEGDNLSPSPTDKTISQVFRGSSDKVRFI